MQRRRFSLNANSSDGQANPSPDNAKEEMPDRYIPDNLDEIMQRVYEHGVVQRRHHIQQGMSEQEYLQATRDTITSPSIIVEANQHGGPTRIYGRKFGNTEQVVVVPSNIVPDHRDPTSFDVTQKNHRHADYFGRKLSKSHESPRILFTTGSIIPVVTKQIASNAIQPASDTLKLNEVKVQQPTSSKPVPAVKTILPTNADEQSTSVPVASHASSGMAPSIDPQKSVPVEHAVNSTLLDDASVGNATSSSTSVDRNSIATSSQSVAEPVTSHDVEASSLDTADINAVEATDESLSASGLTSQENDSVSNSAFDSSEAGSIEAVEMDTRGTDELSDAGEDSLEAGDQSAAVDVSSAEQAESVGDAVDAEGGSDRETGAPSAEEEDESPSALDVLAYEAVESGEISLDSVPSEDDVGAEDVASEEDNGELGPDFLSGDESDMADQAVAAESVDGAQDALADAEMDDGDDIGVESEAGAGGELGAESDASDVPSSDLSLESSEESAEVDDGSLDVDEQTAVEDVAALEDAAGIGDEGDVDLDAVLSAEPAMEDQSGAVDSDDDELDFVSEAEVAELEASLSDSDAALDDAADLQGEFLAADDTEVYDVDESPLAVTDAPADEDVLSDGTADAGDELEFVSEAEVAELEASLSDSSAALDDDFISEDEHADMAAQDSPSTLDDTSDLQDDVFSPDDTSSVDSVDDDFLSMDDLAVDEEDLSDSAVDAGDELGFDEPADVGLDADSDGLDIDTDATDIDANDDIDADDDDDDVSESGGFSL